MSEVRQLVSDVMGRQAQQSGSTAPVLGHCAMWGACVLAELTGGCSQSTRRGIANRKSREAFWDRRAPGSIGPSGLLMQEQASLILGDAGKVKRRQILKNLGCYVKNMGFEGREKGDTAVCRGKEAVLM